MVIRRALAGIDKKDSIAEQTSTLFTNLKPGGWSGPTSNFATLWAHAMARKSPLDDGAAGAGAATKPGKAGAASPATTGTAPG